jgi:hypothetical protein
MTSVLPFLSDEHARAVAHVAIRSAQLDNLIELLIVKLLQPNTNTAEKVLREWGQNKQIDLAQALLLDHYPGRKDDIEAFIIKMKASRSERNDVIHYLWGWAAREDVAILARIRPFRKPVKKTMTARQVKDVADELAFCSARLYELLNWLEKHHWPLPDKPSQPPLPDDSPWPLTPFPKERVVKLPPPPQPAQKSDPEPNDDS